MNRRITAVLLSLLLVVVLAAPTLTAFAAQPDAATDGTIKKASKADIDRIKALWTRENRMKAKDMTFATLNASTMDKVMANAEQAQPQVDPAQAVSIPGGKPNAGADAAAKKAFPETWAKMMTTPSSDLNEIMQTQEAAVEPTGTKGVYNTYVGNIYSYMYMTYPFKAVGRLYFQVTDGSWASCSASVISPNNVIVTAAHCVFDTATNLWYDNWLFVPAERAAYAPYGTFPYATAHIISAWRNASGYSTGIRYDLAAIQLSTNEVGYPVTYYTGYLGRSWDNTYVQSITEIGYPTNLGGGTKYNWVGSSESWSGGTDIFAFGSNMGYGASGSPLFKKFGPYQSGAFNYVMGVQSGSSPNGTYPTFNVGPRFSSTNYPPLCNPTTTWIGC